MGGNFKIISTFSNTYSQCQVKIMQSSYKHLKCFPDIYNMSKQKQASFTVTPPRRGEAQDLEGGRICNPGTCTEFHIHIRDTSPDSDILIYSGSRLL